MNTDLLPLEVSNIPVEGPQNIIRQYPTKKREKYYPQRYNNTVFEKFNEMNTDTELQNDYKKWKAGKNYKTNRKITIGGKIHCELKKKFMIHSVLFEDLSNINASIYLQETDKINDDIDIKNAAIKKYNNMIDSIVKKIKKLENWEDFIVFEGKKYGLVDKIKNNIHMENNCYGEMVFLESGTDFIPNDRPFCNYEDKVITYSIYKCSKCYYENKIIESSTGGGSQYVSKTGFWWK
jgi:hypothetical protein